MTTYAEPPVVVTGQVMTAANWNTWVVNVAKSLWVYTTVGDIAYATAANALGRLGKPSVDSLMKNTSAGTPSWKPISDILPGTTAGDIDYYTAAQVKARLGKPGATGLLQNTSGGTLSWKLLSSILPGTTAGDIDYYTAAQVKARLGKPTVDSLLWNDAGGGITWIAYSSILASILAATHPPSFSTTGLTNTSWDGDTKAVGVYTYYVNTFNASIPNTATALLVSVSVKWAAASDANYLTMRPASGGNCLTVRATNANFFMDSLGVVPLSGDGRFDLEVGGANSTGVYVTIWGYFS